jgi:isopentenyl diphosphate isomerase/L-lactate dehydrogenase-like FMN-dependent dehydrogenase
MSDDYLQERFQNLHEFVKVARQNLDRNNWDYLIGGSETETTLARNRLALDSIGFRPRVLRDVCNVDCTRSLFGRKLRIPVLCAPVGSLLVFEAGGGDPRIRQRHDPVLGIRAGSRQDRRRRA